MRYLVLGLGVSAVVMLVFIAIGILWWVSTQVGFAVVVAVAIAVCAGIAAAALEYITDQPKRVTTKEQAILDALEREV